MPPAGRGTLVGVRVQPVAGLTVSVAVPVPVKPPRDATVTVEVPPGEPTFVVTLVGLALRLIPGGGPAEVTMTDIGPVELVIALFVPPVPVIDVAKVVVDVTLAANKQLVV